MPKSVQDLQTEVGLAVVAAYGVGLDAGIAQGADRVRSDTAQAVLVMKALLSINPLGVGKYLRAGVADHLRRLAQDATLPEDGMALLDAARTVDAPPDKLVAKPKGGAITHLTIN